MGEEGNAKATPAELGPLVEATRREDGFWVDERGSPLRVSASDLERHTYCPLSWRLSRAGVSGEGEAIEAGTVRHREIHRKMVDYQQREQRARRESVIWLWWFTVVVALCADTAAFFFLDEGMVSEAFVGEAGRFLALLALVWLVAALLLIYLPWRQWLGKPFGLAQPPQFGNLTDEEFADLMDSPFRREDDTWFGVGRLESRLLIGSIAIALHGLAIYLAQDRTAVTFAFIILTLVWMLITAWRLHRVIATEEAADEAKTEAGLDKDDILSYSDDDGSTAALLEDAESGLRGRPDQIVNIDSQYIPVEQKTGRVPTRPYDSHEMQVLAYLRLVELTTGVSPAYGILRYGGEALFTVPWDDNSAATLERAIQEVQRLMAEGGAERSHESIGKCKNCSRRKRCPAALA